LGVLFSDCGENARLRFEPAVIGTNDRGDATSMVDRTKEQRLNDWLGFERPATTATQVFFLAGCARHEIARFAMCSSRTSVVQFYVTW
jgi:hypothetical protein